MAMYRKLGKKTKLRKALLRNQVTALIYHGKITTTEARAKEIRKIVEPMITMAAKEYDNYEWLPKSMTTMRQLLSRLKLPARTKTASASKRLLTASA